LDIGLIVDKRISAIQYQHNQTNVFFKYPDNRSKCRGFGYVQFVLQEDADKAVTSPKNVGSRSLNICYADKKPKHEKRKKGNK